MSRSNIPPPTYSETIPSAPPWTPTPDYHTDFNRGGVTQGVVNLALEHIDEEVYNRGDHHRTGGNGSYGNYHGNHSHRTTCYGYSDAIETTGR